MRLIVCALLCLSLPVQAKVSCPGGVQFKNKLSMDDNGQKVLKLNGVGKRRFFLFDLFYVALYLEKTNSNANQIIKSQQTKVGLIHLLRNISRDQLLAEWDDEFRRLCGSQCKQLRPYHNQFRGYIRSFKKGERLYLMSFSDRLEVEINKNEFFKPVFSAEYGRLLQRILIGPESLDKKLEKGLLGKSKICK